MQFGLDTALSSRADAPVQTQVQQPSILHHSPLEVAVRQRVRVQVHAEAEGEAEIELAEEAMKMAMERNCSLLVGSWSWSSWWLCR
jgi:hypothetical protein